MKTFDLIASFETEGDRMAAIQALDDASEAVMIEGPFDVEVLHYDDEPDDDNPLIERDCDYWNRSE